jgi:hypothetical protein
MPFETKAIPLRPTIVKTHDGAARSAAMTAANTGSRGPEDFLGAEDADCGCSLPPMFRAPGADETAKPGNVWPDYLEALELINGAGQAMTALEDHSQKIQAKAFELSQKARADRLAASQQIASLQQQLAASETRVAELDSLLAEAELRAQTAQEWLRRFLETINGAFSTHRADPRQAGKNNPGTAA